MQSDEPQEDAVAPRAAQVRESISRRRVLGRMSLVATAGAAAWVVPEILTARPAGGATLSSPVVVGATSVGATSEGPIAVPASAIPGSTPPSAAVPTLAFTGLNIQRDAEVGAALLAGGWAMHHWASRTATSARVEDPGAPA